MWNSKQTYYEINMNRHRAEEFAENEEAIEADIWRDNEVQMASATLL